ncbi:hypothetical protein ACJMK2_018558 [Sinanodonta woodiana]|uniref:Peptidase S54 rhomboid domain-containing protein n=1 Tax=Sinanodonta woodiana TaxID=1069815 RepID=A0ABD3UHE2_SINWO
MANYQRRGGNLGILLLGLQMANFGFDRIPPVTLVAIVTQVAIYLNLGDLGRWFSATENVCISAYYVWRRGEWNRLFLGTLCHADDIHLYYNMISLLWKGHHLERKFKSVYFAYLLAVFTVLSSVVLVALHILLAHMYDDRSYELTCAVGFSGVLFALKVLSVHYSPFGTHYLLGFIPVPSKHVYWAELALIHFLVPNASFTGHLAGILVGLMYTKGPLKAIMDSFISPGPSYSYTARTTGYQDIPGYTTGGRAAFRQPEPADNTGYYEYSGGLSEEEQIRRATEESRREYEIIFLVFFTNSCPNSQIFPPIFTNC